MEWTKAAGWQPTDPVPDNFDLTGLSKEALIDLIEEQRSTLKKKQKIIEDREALVTKYQNLLDEKDKQVLALKLDVDTLQTLNDNQKGNLQILQKDKDYLYEQIQKKNQMIVALKQESSYQKNLAADLQNKLDNIPDKTKNAVTQMLEYKKLYEELSQQGEAATDEYYELKARWQALNKVVHDSQSVGPLASYEWLSLRYGALDFVANGMAKTNEQAQMLSVLRAALFTFLRTGGDDDDAIIFEKKFQDAVVAMPHLLNDPRFSKLWTYYIDGIKK